MTAPVDFARHVFISYAHLDNQPLTPGQLGWVTRFHASLEATLSMRLGRQARIWRDNKITGSDVFADETLSQLPATALLVSVVSPRYVESDWCLREMRAFCDAAEVAGSLVVDGKSRIIKVIKTPVDAEHGLPAPVQSTLGYPFYVVDQGAPLELDEAYGEALGELYLQKVVKLAWDLSQLLRTLETSAHDTRKARVPSRPTVYLASCAHDMSDAREKIEADLKFSGCTVLPDRALPMEERAHERAVQELLARSQLAIHLVGRGYGVVPDGSGARSVVVIENELAASRSREHGLPRLIWLREGTKANNPQQAQFIGAIHASAELQSGADVVTAELESFRNVMHSALDALASTAARKATPVVASDPFVYLLCDERDRGETIPLRKQLKARGIDVRIPAFEGSSTALRQANDDLLATCDAALVFYGRGDEAWKRSVDADLRKARALRGANPLPPVPTVLAPPATADKRELIALDEPHLVDALDGIDPARFEPFVASLRGGAVP